MKFLYLSILVFFVTIGFGQNRFSKHIDIGKQENSDYVLWSLEKNDTLYFNAFHPCFLEGDDWYPCNSIGMMDKEGEILSQRKVPWLSTTGFNKTPATIDGDRLLIAGSHSYLEHNVSLSILDRYTLDSLTTMHYTLDSTYQYYYASGLVATPSYYVITGWSRIYDTDIWPDWMLWINKESLEIEYITEYPYYKISVVPEQVFNDGDSIIMYFSGIETRPDSNGLYGFDSRGFLRYEPQDNLPPEVTYFYQDSLNDEISGHRYLFNSLLLTNGDMLYRQEYRRPPDSLPVLTRNGSEYELICIDDVGNIVWRNHDIGWNRYGEKELLSLVETDDGYILGAGYTEWGFELETYYEYEFLLGEQDTIQQILSNLDSIGRYWAPYFAKFDMHTGELIWEYAFIDMDDNFSAPYTSYNVYELSDGSLMGAGRYTFRDGHPTIAIDYDSWFYRLPGDYCMSGDYECTLEQLLTDTDDGVWVDISRNKPYNIYPNPAVDHINIQSASGNTEELYIELYGAGAERILSTPYRTGETLQIPSSMRGNKMVVAIKDRKGQHLWSELIIVR